MKKHVVQNLLLTLVATITSIMYVAILIACLYIGGNNIYEIIFLNMQHNFVLNLLLIFFSETIALICVVPLLLISKILMK